MSSTTPAPACIGRSLASTLRCTPRCLRTGFAVSVFDRVLVGIVISFSRDNACRWKRLASFGLAPWQEWADNVSGGAMPGGHFFPVETAAALRAFFQGK